MSHHDTYVIPEKTSISKDSCSADLAASDALARNDAGTCAQDWHKSDTDHSGIVHGSDMENPGALAGATGVKDIVESIYFSLIYITVPRINSTLFCGVAA